MKKLIYTILFLGGAWTTVTTLTSSGEPDIQNTYDQSPPIAQNFYVQKLASPVAGGVT